jgi:hypothetical protein
MNEIIFVVEDSPEGGYVAKAAGEHDPAVPRQHGERAEVEDLVVQRARARGRFAPRPAVQVGAWNYLMCAASSSLFEQ